MRDKLIHCPCCGEHLIFPKGNYSYCEDCGWPDEDFDGEYVYPQQGEQLADYQPGLEFFNGKDWVASGVITCSVSGKFLGLYRKYALKGGKP